MGHDPQADAPVTNDDHDTRQRTALVTAMIASNGNPDTLRVMADWLEQRGECDLAYAYRWAASRDRWPKQGGPNVGQNQWWSWSIPPTQNQSTVPVSLKNKIVYIFAVSVEDAFQRLANALAQLKEDVSIHD